MAHPDVEQAVTVFVGFVLNAIKQFCMTTRTNFRKAKFAWFAEGFGSFNFSAQLLRHRLHAVANTEHWHAELKHNLWRTRRITLGHRIGSARENDAFRAIVGYELRRDIVRVNFSKNPCIAHTAGDELGDVCAEMDDEDFIVVVGHVFL